MERKFLLFTQGSSMIKSLNNTCSNVTIGGGSLHEFSHAVHLMIILIIYFLEKKFKFKADIKFSKNLKIKIRQPFKNIMF